MGKILNEIANSIDPNLVLTCDVPSDHLDKKGRPRLPYLDMVVWMDYSDPKYPHGKALYKYYEKPTASRLVLEADTAQSKREIHHILTSEGVRRLRNTHIELPEEEIEEVLSEFMKKLQNAGHDLQTRKAILASARNKFDHQVKNSLEGTTPLHRWWSLERERRDKEHKEKTKNWYKGKGNKYKHCMFVPATPGGELK